MQKIWDNCKAPNKGSLVEFVLIGDRRIVGYYLGFDAEKNMYALCHSTYDIEKKYFVSKQNIKIQYVLALR